MTIGASGFASRSASRIPRRLSTYRPRAAATASAIAALLDLPDQERLALRRRIRAAALDRFSWETLRPSVVELYRNLAGERS